MAVQVLYGASIGSTLSTSATQYNPIFFDAIQLSENLGTSVCAAAGVFNNLVVWISADPAGSGSRTFALRVNGVDSALTVTINAGSTTGRITGTDVAVSAGDRITLKSTVANTPVAASLIYTLEFVPTTGAQSIYGGAWAITGASGTRYTNPMHAGASATGTTLGVVETTVISCAGTITGLYGHWSNAPTAGQGGTFHLYLNGVLQDGSGGSTDTTLDMVSTQSNNVNPGLTVVAGDEIALRGVMEAGAFNQTFQFGVQFTASTVGQSIHSGASASFNSNSAATFSYVQRTQSPWGGTENTFVALSRGGVSDFDLSGLRILFETAPGTGKSRTIELRHNLASPVGGPTVTVSDTNVRATGTGAAETIVDGDTFALQQTPTGTPTTTAEVSWAFVMTTGAPPIGVEDVYDTPYNTTLTVLAEAGVLVNDTRATTATLDTDVSNGTLTLNSDGSFVYTPTIGFIGDDVFTYIPSNAFGDGGVTTVTITVLEPEPPEGGGEVDPGSPPPAADLPTGVMRRFITVQRLDGSLLGAADTDFFHDPIEWYGGYKPAELLSISAYERELSRQGDFKGIEVRILLDDTRRRWRTLANQEAIAGAYGAIYIVSDDVRYALGEPYRRFAGRVVSHRALDDLRYELVLRDLLSEQIASLDMAPRCPSEVLTATRFPGMYPPTEGKAAPLLIGAVTDEGAVTPGEEQGVVPPLVFAGINLNYFGGINKSVIACLFSIGAWSQNGLWTLFYNPPDTPSVRIQVPDANFGVNVWAPGKAGWGDTGLAADYVDYPLPFSDDTRRYTPVFFDAEDPLAEPFLEEAVLIAANAYGISEFGNGLGRYISDPSRAWQWLYVNQLFVPYTFGDYADMPTLDGVYEAIDTASVERTRTRQHARLSGGYTIGFLLGRDGQQQTMRHVAQELCLGTDMQQGINRHGQLVIDTEDASAEPVARLSDLLDITAGDFSVTVDRDWYFNRIERYHGYRYVPPSAPNPTRAEGEPAPQHIQEFSPWESGVVVNWNQDSIDTNRGIVKTYVLENYVVRDDTVAEAVATVLLDRAIGPAPGYDGPRVFRLVAPLMKILAIEVGDNILIDHVDGYGDGYVGQVGRVLKISEDTDTWTGALEGYLLTTDGSSVIGSGSVTVPVGSVGSSGSTVTTEIAVGTGTASVPSGAVTITGNYMGIAFILPNAGALSLVGRSPTVSVSP